MAQGSLPLLIALCLAVCCVVAYEIIQGLVFASRLKAPNPNPAAWSLPSPKPHPRRLPRPPSTPKPLPWTPKVMVWGLLPEEQFPSDHLMVTANLKWGAPGTRT